MEHANVVIIGGGVVGCAIARALSSRWGDVFLLEAMPKLAMGASSRNSGVIHSGLYYHPGSLKAKHCVRGNQLTYEFCAAHNVPHRKIGKLVVASSQGEEKDLFALVENGRTNGLEGLSILDRDAIRAREPHVEGFKAIGVPSTGIVASEELVKTYARIATENGANIVTHARVEHLDSAGECLRVVSTAGEIETRCLVNSAGLFADEVAALLGSKMAQHHIYPVRGEYCELTRDKQDLVRGLVYPLPHADGLSLGVHILPKRSGAAFSSARPRAISTTKTTTNGTVNRLNISLISQKNFCRRLRRLISFPRIRASAPSWSLRPVYPEGCLKQPEWLTSSSSRIPTFRAQFT